MLKILNRFAWLISIAIGIGIIALMGKIFFVLRIFMMFFIKFLVLSDDFIEQNLEKYGENIIDYKLSEGKKSEINNENNKKEVSDTNIETNKQENIFNETEKLEDSIKNENIINNISIYEQENDDNSKAEKQEKSKIISYLNSFFAENLLAKIGGILLTLGILFLMSLVYSIVGPVAKILIGISLGFLIYIIGVLLVKKGLDTEGMILIGTGILINYIVILSGRYLIGNDGILSSSTTFIFLILNTIFSVLTAYIYNSKNLLLFSVFIAYLVPFLVGSTGSKYSYLILIGYSLILSIGTLSISNFKNKLLETDVSIILLYFTIILGNLLVLSAPINDTICFAAKMIGFNIITFSSIFLAYKNNFRKHIISIFTISYIFLVLIIIIGNITLGGAFAGISILISYLIGIFGLLFASVFFIIGGIGAGILYFLFIPILFILGILFTGHLFAGIFLIPIILIIYLFSFSLIAKSIVGSLFKYIFFIIIGGFLSISNIYFKINLSLDIYTFISMIVSSFIFLISSYYLSSKKDLTYLYSIGTLASILIFLPVITITGEFYLLSAISVVIFGIINYILPFINSNLVKNDSRNLVLGNIFGILFIGGNLFRFGNEYFPGTSLGIGFLVLAIIYFFGRFVIFNKFDENEIKEESNLNFLYTFLAISISLFSISIALLFSKSPMIISLVWLLESSVLIYFASKLNSIKIYIAGIILLTIGLVKYFNNLIEIELVYADLIAIIFIGISLFLNIIFVKKSIDNDSIIIIKILHIIGIIILYFSLLNIFKNDLNTLIFSAIFLVSLHIIYNIIKDDFLKSTLIGAMGIGFLIHLGLVDIQKKYFYNYIFTSILGFSLFIEYFNFKDEKSKYLAWVYGIYFVLISSFFLYHNTNDYFSLTIYWGILALIGIHIGIGKNYKIIRTVGMYLLIITLLKIVFYDIWNEVDNGIIRIIAFMFVGGLMIYVSSIYSKNKLSINNDLNFGDFYDKNNNNEKLDTIKENSDDYKKINEKIKAIDISNIENIKFIFLDGNSILIKSKNLFKIVILITENLGKTKFKSNELKNIYNDILENYKSELNETDFKKLNSIIGNFVLVGGSIEINKK